MPYNEILDLIQSNKNDFYNLIEERLEDLDEMEVVIEETKNLLKSASNFIEKQNTVIEVLLERLEEPGFPFPEIDLWQVREEYVEEKGSINWGNFGQGLLSASGYRVGKTNGLPEQERRKILNYIFLKDSLEDIDDAEYRMEWGDPKSSERLRKLANVVATLANNASRKRGDFSHAIWDWHSDLMYLKHQFYDRWADFPWPEVEYEFQ